ncbi:LOW QUALITY PROTEIN: C-factor [Boleophthalmus pectinirostris]|uniref:LOW QUALITY PROTEIN: C-factor n=1 Tax=Boleophthalmus pectinirostris TaxID=150288 RepID=UPI00242FA8D2|nr:LOW QUALITY PROTEIN: C-factor [Boleophthalmus pectinirostris]
MKISTWCGEYCCSVMITGASTGLGLQIVESLVNGDNSTQPGHRNFEKCPRKIPKFTLSPWVLTLTITLQPNKSGTIELITNVVADFGSVTAEKMMENFQTNAVAPLMITKANLPLLKKAASKEVAMGIQRAAVINVSSLLSSVELSWGERANNFKWYPEPPSALNMLNRCMTIDLESNGILRVALHLGWIQTDMGGSKAPLSPVERISVVFSVIGGLTDKNHRSFVNFTGKQLPW